MQGWDRLVMMLIGLGVAGWTGRTGWRSWRDGERMAAAGALLLVLLVIALPVVLAMAQK